VNSYYILMIVISAFLHAFYNFMMRKAGGSKGFLLTMFLMTAGISIVVAASTERLAIPWNHLPYVYGASLFYVLYQVLVSKSYETGNISALYPLTVLSPIFIPFWAFILLSESISILTGIGILVTVIGAICVNLRSVSLQEFRKIFQLHGDYRGARFALGASFMYSFGAILDKSRIAYFPLGTYLSLILCFMAVNMALYWSFSEKQALPAVVRTYWKSGLLGGITIYLSFLFFRVALKQVFVSLAVPVRQVAIIFAILLGILFLKEKMKTSNLIGSLVIILGIILINAGT
jgi:drug/metabolite transporter (DMT)-like permease